MPSIASEYVRNRTKHDNTAREWTRLHAQQTKESPVALTNGKGKARAPVPSTQTEGNVRARRAGRQPRTDHGASTDGEVIDLSDLEGQTSQTTQRVGARTRAAGTKRKRGPDDTNETGGGGSSRRRLVADDVIVIED